MMEGHLRRDGCGIGPDSASPQLEICAETEQACTAAFEGGAHRIEICTALRQGGVTPSHGLIRAAIAAANGLPIYVLLRPRAGNFIYSGSEFKTMCVDLEHAASLGAAGFAAGILTRERKVDEARMRYLVKLAGTKEVTFHRAFDHALDLNEALEQIVDVGCGRLLTSGGKPTVREGMNTIAELNQRCAKRMRIAAGGGVTPEIAAELRRIAPVDLHVSLRKKAEFGGSRVKDPLWDTEDETTEISVPEIEAIAAVLVGSDRSR